MQRAAATEILVKSPANCVTAELLTQMLGTPLNKGLPDGWELAGLLTKS